MMNFALAKLEKIMVHNVGNKANGDMNTISRDYLRPKEELVIDLLKKYFLGPFKEEIYYQFEHESDLQLNEVYRIASEIFANPVSLNEKSVELAEHLFNQSIHPAIKRGEFFVAYIKEVKFGDEFIDAIGLFKSENKETILKVYQENSDIGLNHETGININKLDKGCLIFNIEKEEGYRACVIDKTSKVELAAYWKNDFLNVELRQDSFFHTQNYLDICKNFTEDVFSPENDVERSDQALFLNRSINYFDEHDVFNEEEFKAEVIQEESVINAFDEYKSTFVEENDIPTDDNFGVSQAAIKAQKRHFKSILKLDKNFHVYIHGSQRLIEKGFDDESGFSYYKLFFENEVG